MKPNLILANPTAGRGKGARVLTESLEHLDNHRVRYEVIAASSLESSLQQLHQRNLNNFQRLFVLGGDGMMHHAINAISTNELPVGLIPAGTGNDFARALGMNLKKPANNIDLFLATEPARVDLGLVNGKRFAAICSTGFDSLVNERANSMLWPRGKRKYDIAMLQELPRFKPRRYHITVDGVSREVEAMLLAIGNGSSYGGGMKVCPDANLFDGLLDLMILHPVPKLEFIRIFPKVYSGAHSTHDKVEFIRGKEISITGDAVTYADGERISPTPVNVSVHEGALATWVNHA